MEMSGASSEDVCRRLVAGLAKIGLVMRHRAWMQGETTGLTPTQAQVLVLLAGRSRLGLPVSAIASELALSQPTISDAVTALSQKGLVAKKRSVDDARIVRISLTRKGRGMAGEVADWPDALSRAVQALDDSERASFAAVLVKMIYALQLDGQIPISRMCPTCTYFRPNVHGDQTRPHHCAYVDAPLGNTDLRFDCTDHQMLPPPDRQRIWNLFIGGKPLAGGVPASSP